MVVVGKTDQFEHLYTERFRAFAAKFGHFVQYERDIATRDIGLHLTTPLETGGVKLTNCLCWFQMKGIMAETLGADEAKAATSFKYRMKVDHLKFWFLQPMPTYLALYVQSLDRFYILNLQKYVEDTWGRSILTLDQETAQVEVPSGSLLDEDALKIILRRSTVEEWTKALSADASQMRLCERDYSVIWRMGTAAERKVEQRFEIYDWQSKTRGEVHIQERATGGSGDWTTIRNHWQLFLRAIDVEEMYPYLNFDADEEGEERSESYEDEEYSFSFPWETEADEYRPTFRLKNGQIAAGEDCAGEFHLYYIIPRLNELGQSLYGLIKTLVDLKFIEIKDDRGEFVSIAPWHARQV